MRKPDEVDAKRPRPTEKRVWASVSSKREVDGDFAVGYAPLMRRKLALAAVAVCVTLGFVVMLGSCGSKDEEAAGPPDASVPSGSLKGRIQYVSTITVPAHLRPKYLENRAAIEATGSKLAADGSSMSKPAAGAQGWVLELAGKRAFTDTTGEFEIEVVPGTTAAISIRHPMELKRDVIPAQERRDPAAAVQSEDREMSLIETRALESAEDTWTS